ncbi:MAG: protein-glutamate O-methyltransferase CheR [Aliarcobacter sp.]|nr:protein-glutamate O-methyltransferase CheR [Aliarcobacter sp.]
MSKLYQETNVDFSQYKNTTISRRIERRMSILKVASIIDYNNYLIKNKAEIKELFKDILIGVTSFFRDEESFEELEKKLTDYINKKNDNIIRIWSPGCSTGEEPYTIAIILAEILKENIADFKIQIFASDLDIRAIDTARKGLYSQSSILTIPKKLKSKYFIQKNDQFEIIKPIKEMLIFSHHDITRDPPFLKLDLISCRNLLIYFTSDLQKKIFPLFHYSLNAGGILFLGKSESIGQFQNYFKPIDKKYKMYEALYLGKKETLIMHTNYVSSKYKEPEFKLSNTKTLSMDEILISKIQEFILPSCVMINETMEIVFIKGFNKYLIRPDGKPTNNIFKNLNHKLAVDLRTLLTKLKDNDTEIIKSKYQKIILDENNIRYVRIALIPVLKEANLAPVYILFFQEEKLEHIQEIKVQKNQVIMKK